MSPHEIHVLLECHTSADPGINIKPGIWMSSATREALALFISLGLIDNETLITTQKGDELAKKLCAVELT